MVFDTASMYFRSFFGLPSSMRAPDGTPVNAVRGLLDSMARLIDQYRPTQLACAWDNDWRPAWRVALVPSYKAHRVAVAVPASHQIVGAGGVGAQSGQGEESPDELAVQIPIIEVVLGALGVAIVGKDGYEADDVAGSLASQAEVPTLVVTGDRDLFQLAHGHTAVLYIGKGVAKHEQVTDAWVQAKYGVSAQQYVDFAVLRGDPSDGLPGVKGIGEKSAAQLIAKYGNLQQLAVAASDPASDMPGGMRAKLAASVDYLAVAREVVETVNTLDLGTPPLQIDPARRDNDLLAELGIQFNLGGSLDRIISALDAACATR